MKSQKQRNFVAKHAAKQTRNSAGPHKDKRRKELEDFLKNAPRSNLDMFI